MKKTILLSLVLLVAFFAFQGWASAETFSGKIASIDAAGNKLSISYPDSATGDPVNVDILVGSGTTYAGVASLADLKEGEEVSVEVTKDEATGAQNATSVTLSQPAEQPVEAAKEDATL